MQRTIKFRVWDKINKIMVTNENVKEVLNNEKLIDDDWVYDGDEWYPAYEILIPLLYLKTISTNKNFVLEQYTGLCDKNGVEIYENDRVRLLDHNEKEIICYVEYIMGGFWYVVEKNKLTIAVHEYVRCLNKSVEVIGNVHEDIAK